MLSRRIYIYRNMHASDYGQTLCIKSHSVLRIASRSGQSHFARISRGTHMVISAVGRDSHKKWFATSLHGLTTCSKRHTWAPSRSPREWVRFRSVLRGAAATVFPSDRFHPICMRPVPDNKDKSTHRDRIPKMDFVSYWLVEYDIEWFLAPSYDFWEENFFG